MIERWKRESDFYLIFTGLLTLSIIAFANLAVPSTRSIISVLSTIPCLIICFAISESILVRYIRRPRLRKLLVMLSLFLTPTAPFIFHGPGQIIVIALLSVWLFSTRQFFYFEKGNLYLCGLCAIAICFMAPALAPFLIFQCYFFFKRDRENSYFLFTFFALPGLLWLVYNWENTHTIFSPNFRKLHPQLFSNNIIETFFILQEHLLSMAHQPIVLIGFFTVLVCLFIQQNQSSSTTNPWTFDLNLSLLYCYPLMTVVYGSQMMDNHNYLNFLLSFCFILILLPKLKEFYIAKNSLLSIKFGLFLIIFIGIYPFYINAISDGKSQSRVSYQPADQNE